MEFEDKIRNINNDTFVGKRLNVLKYLIYENLSLPKESISVVAVPRMSFSEKSNQYTDVTAVEFQIDISIDFVPVLDEFASIFNKVQKNLDSIFKKIGINQFLEIIKNPQSSSYNYMPMVTHLNFDNGVLELHIFAEYETIEVEGAGNL